MILFLTIKRHSQRVPNKNFRKLDGKEELYLRCINKFKNKYKILLDTDGVDIIKKVNQNVKNVFVNKRDKNLVGDNVSTDDILRFHINEIKNYFNEDIIAHIFTTAPFLKLNTLNMAYSFLKNNNLDSVFSADLIKKRLWRNENYGLCPINHNPLKLEQTQNLPNYFIENSVFYIFKVSAFIKYGSRICGKSKPFIIDFPENIDIDDIKDYNLCKKLIKAKIC